MGMGMGMGSENEGEKVDIRGGHKENGQTFSFTPSTPLRLKIPPHKNTEVECVDQRLKEH